MSHPTSSALVAALRRQLPRDLQHLAETVAAQIEAALGGSNEGRARAVLDARADNPETADELARVASALTGVSLPSPVGLITLGANSQTGDLTVEKIAGRDINTVVVINIAAAPMPVVPRVLPNDGLSPAQVELLVFLKDIDGKRGMKLGEIVSTLAAALDCDRAEIERELRDLCATRPELVTLETRRFSTWVYLTDAGERCAEIFGPKRGR